MCSRPLTFNGYEVSCLECDQCVGTYKNTWVARCVAQKQTLPFAYAFTLTYADVNGEPPLGARVYRYRDVQLMWKRIRRAAQRRWGSEFELCYVVVGEKGTKKGRCHYHGVMFASHPVEELGTMASASGGGFAYKRRLEWSLWGHGFVEFQMADRKGMSYVLKYILKSRMSAKRSEGTKREGQTEWLASSYLWCSKIPAIGETWLKEKVTGLLEMGMCPPSLRVRVPGGGDWYVRGKMQMEMCLAIYEANQKFKEEFGHDLAGYKPLVESVSGEIELSDTGEVVKRKPWEWLVNGEEEEEYIAPSTERIKLEEERQFIEYQTKQWRRSVVSAARNTVRKCGGILPCSECLKFLSSDQIADLEQERKLVFEQWRSRYFGQSWEEEREFERWWQTRLRPSRGCAKREDETLRIQFRSLVSVTKAERGLIGREAVGKSSWMQEEA